MRTLIVREITVDKSICWVVYVLGILLLGQANMLNSIRKWSDIANVTGRQSGQHYNTIKSNPRCCNCNELAHAD